jgi:hypothetical protein
MVRIKITDRSLQHNMARLRARIPHELDTAAKTMAAIGKEYARDIVTVVIYQTPMRSGYKRTRFLLRSIYSTVKRSERGRVITVGAAADYSAYQELGTYEGYLGEGAAEEQILRDARAFGAFLITLEYGRVERGLEPRPFILPALIMLERELPYHVEEAIYRLLKGIGRG